MLTRSGAASRPHRVDDPYETVTTAPALRAAGWTEAGIRHQFAARRWQRCGRAILLHNGPVHPAEVPRVALANCGPRGLLTAFTAAELHGLRTWERPEVHVLVPAGARIVRPPGLRLRVHYTGCWETAVLHHARGLDSIESALVRAAATFGSARPASAILAAGVQQRLVSASELRTAVENAPRIRHRADLLHALADIGQGSEALSEIDFVRLCRRYRLPAPHRQAVRDGPDGRRRYLDAEWRRRDGRRVVAEVDGALHLAPVNWWNDQLRQNELTIGGAIVLRFPSIEVRREGARVAAQLRHALLL